MNTIGKTIVVATTAALLSLGGEPATALEEPEYTVLRTSADYEIRAYKPYIVAETDVAGDFRTSGKQAFGILAGYIFGDNQTAVKMQMTAPVESRPAGDGVAMAMTAPVTSQPVPGSPDEYTYGFVMERAYTMETLPVPNDPRIRIRVVEPRVVAARRYSGLWTHGSFLQQETALLGALEADEVAVAGTAWLARYNGPLTPWFLRRNEVMVEVDWPADDIAQ